MREDALQALKDKSQTMEEELAFARARIANQVRETVWYSDVLDVEVLALMPEHGYSSMLVQTNDSLALMQMEPLALLQEESDKSAHYLQLVDDFTDDLHEKFKLTCGREECLANYRFTDHQRYHEAKIDNVGLLKVKTPDFTGSAALSQTADGLNMMVSMGAETKVTVQHKQYEMDGLVIAPETRATMFASGSGSAAIGKEGLTVEGRVKSGGTISSRLPVTYDTGVGNVKFHSTTAVSLEGSVEAGITAGCGKQVTGKSQCKYNKDLMAVAGGKIEGRHQVGNDDASVSYGGGAIIGGAGVSGSTSLGFTNGKMDIGATVCFSAAVGVCGSFGFKLDLAIVDKFVTEVMPEMVDFLGGHVGDLGETFAKEFEDIGTAAEDGAKMIWDATVGEGITHAAKETASLAMEAGKVGVLVVDEALGEVVSFASTALTKTAEVMRKGVEVCVKEFPRALAKTAQAVAETATQGATMIVKAVVKVIEVLGEFLGNAAEWVGDRIEDAVKVAQQFATSVASWGSSVLGGLFR